MNWPERTKDSKTFIVVSKKANQRQILSVSSLKYQIIPHLSVRGYNILPSKGGEFKSNHRWNCFGGMTTKTIKIWLNLYRWIRNCMNFVNGANSEIITLLTILFDLSPGKPRKRYRKILLYLKFKFSSKSWYFIGGVRIENWIYHQRIHINWMHKAQRRSLNKWVPFEIQLKNAIS